MECRIGTGIKTIGTRPDYWLWREQCHVALGNNPEMTRQRIVRNWDSSQEDERLRYLPLNWEFVFIPS